MQTEVNTIAICGAGTMGAGIAQVAAQSGYQTILFDPNIGALEKAKEAITNALATLVEKKKIPPEKKLQILGAIRFTNEVEDCKAELIIEAIIEDLTAKADIFRKLSSFNPHQTIFATNTSSLSVSAIATTIPYPGRVAGLHFFNPPSLMKLVEVVSGKETTDEVINLLMETVKQLGKMPVLCNDFPGFIVNRVARPFYLEALKIIEEGKADFETIDKVMEATGFKMGPFRLMDMIGNDINLAVTESLFKAFDKPVRLKPSSIQQEKVQQGMLGRKSGKGYYEY